MAAATPTPTEVAAKKQGLHIAPETRSHAMKVLNAMKKRDPDFEISEDTIKTYVSLKALLPAGKAVTKGMLESVKVKAGRSTTLGSKYYVQWRTTLPRVPDECLRYLRDAQAIADFPAGISPDDVWIFAKGVNTDLIGDDYQYMKSEGTISRKVAVDGECLVVLADGRAGESPAAAATAAAPAPAEASAPAAPAQPQESSNDAAGEVDVFETIAKSCKEFADKKQHVPPEGQMHPRTVLFWADRFAKYLEARRTLDTADQKLLGFMLKTLLQMDDFTAFMQFRTFLETLDLLPGDVLPPLGRAMLNLAQDRCCGEPLASECPRPPSTCDPRGYFGERPAEKLCHTSGCVDCPKGSHICDESKVHWLPACPNTKHCTPLGCEAGADPDLLSLEHCCGECS